MILLISHFLVFLHLIYIVRYKNAINAILIVTFSLDCRSSHTFAVHKIGLMLSFINYLIH